MSSDGAIPGRRAGSGARPYILLGNASHHSSSGVCDRVPSPPPSQDNAYFVKKTELACHIAILTGPGGARAAICPTTTEFFSSTVRSAFLSSSGTVAAAATLLFLPLLQAPTVLPTPPARPSPRLAPSSCSLPSPVPSPHSCHVAGLPWALPTTGLPSFWSAEDGR